MLFWFVDQHGYVVTGRFGETATVGFINELGLINEL